jgi:molybdate transport system substrate-binding protein
MAAGAARLLAVLLVIAPISAVRAAERNVLCVVAMKSAMSELVPQFERATGDKLLIEYATAGVVSARIDSGENVDVAISARQQIASLEKSGRIVEGTAIDVAKFGVGVFVAQGATKPAIDSVDAFKRTLRSAKSIAHADPARGGVTAVYVANLLGQLDIAADIRPKITVFAPGAYESVATGQVELGFGGISEILADPSVQFVGPLPAAIQNYTVFAGGIVAGSKQQAAGKAFLQFVSSPATSALLKAKGFEPRD